MIVAGSGKFEKPDLPRYTMEEISKHNKPDDMWTVYGNKVYNVTNYAKLHPGGAKIIRDFAGKDMTKEYSIFCK